MLLKNILKNINCQTKGEINHKNIQNLCFNTSAMHKNSLFFCLTGVNEDGHNYAQNAVELGAVAIVVEKFLNLDVVQIKVENARAAMALCSANFYGNPAKKLKLIGVTGTNGKTSTTYILKSILETSGYKVGLFGTIGIYIGNKKLKTNMTTPDPIVFHKVLAQMVKQKIDYVVMEVSAHAISLNKMEGVKFLVGILTNITQDHLDFFKTFSNYAKTKLSFISPKYCINGVVNLDDKLASNVYKNSLSIGFNCFGFGLNNKVGQKCLSYSLQNNGLKFNVEANGYTFNCSSALMGKFNLYNILGAICACSVLGIEQKNIIQGVKNVLPILGRFNVLPLKNGAYAVIDYAHTPDGLQKILTSAKEISKGRVISVFGCGGNRDRLKRPLMGQISVSLADFTIITSDNPRFEEPQSIIIDIKKGIPKNYKNYMCITDRKKAIENAVSLSKPNDFVVISGKGAEDYLDIKGQKISYSDYKVINKINQKR